MLAPSLHSAGVVMQTGGGEPSPKLTPALQYPFPGLGANWYSSGMTFYGETN